MSTVFHTFLSSFLLLAVILNFSLVLGLWICGICVSPFLSEWVQGAPPRTGRRGREVSLDSPVQILNSRLATGGASETGKDVYSSLADQDHVLTSVCFQGALDLCSVHRQARPAKNSLSNLACPCSKFF